MYNTYTCAHCRKTFTTDNAWIWCEKNPDPDAYESTIVKARFCSNACRTHYLVDRGWVLDVLHRLVPPEANNEGVSDG